MKLKAVVCTSTSSAQASSEVVEYREAVYAA